MLRECSIIILMLVSATYGYFSLPGPCPAVRKVQQDFRLADFFDKWHQVYHYSSDQSQLNNCSTIELVIRNTGIYVNMSRVDRGLFRRSSVARIIDDGSAKLEVEFIDLNAPRRLVKRQYPFWILAKTNYFATAYTCQYSQLINKHYIYIWVLSRSKLLNDVSMELAAKSIKASLGIEREVLRKDDLSDDKCTPKYFEENPVAPVTFRTPVPM